MWKLFLDDERNPVSDGWYIARTSADAQEAVRRWGMPVEIAFDHDLGGDDTAIRFIWWLIDQYYDGHVRFPADFKYSIHSQNPVGAANIRGLMEGFIRDVIWG